MRADTADLGTNGQTRGDAAFTRRNALRRLAQLVAGGLLAWIPGPAAGAPRTGHRPPAAPHAGPADNVDVTARARIFEDLASAVAIGAAYVARYPDDCHDLHARLSEGLTPDMTPTDRRDWLRARLRDDFANDRTVTLDGWVLARTEAQLCAFVYLEYGSDE